MHRVRRHILEVCAGCDELSVPVRRSDKRTLNDLNKRVRFPPGRREIIRTPADKVKALSAASLATGGGSEMGGGGYMKICFSARTCRVSYDIVRTPTTS